MHTPEPWSVGQYPNGLLRIDAREPDGTPCQPVRVNGDPTDPVYGPVTWANAHRIVACVNGCAGIADPAAVGELLTVAQKVTDCLEHVVEIMDSRECRAHAKELRAAIAKVTASETKSAQE